MGSIRSVWDRLQLVQIVSVLLDRSKMGLDWTEMDQTELKQIRDLIRIILQIVADRLAQFLVWAVVPVLVLVTVFSAN